MMKFNPTQLESTDGVYNYRLLLMHGTELWSALRWPVGYAQIPPLTDVLTSGREWSPIVKQALLDDEVMYERLDYLTTVLRTGKVPA